MIRRSFVGLFGGTFDPVHKGHLAMAAHFLEHVQFDTLYFIPAADPPHKCAVIPASERLCMLKLALVGLASCKVSDIELERNGPSYTIDTLRSMRLSYPDAALVFVLGADAFATLSTWHEWQSLLNYAHLWVMPRAGVVLSGEMSAYYRAHACFDREQLSRAPSGMIYWSKQTVSSLSSTQLRAQLCAGLDCHNDLPPATYAYIKQHHLYRS